MKANQKRMSGGHSQDEENLPLLASMEPREVGSTMAGGYSGAQVSPQRQQSVSFQQSEMRAVDEPEDPFGGNNSSYQHGHSFSGAGGEMRGDDVGGINVDVQAEDEPTINRGGPTVTCRVCEVDISLEGRTSQHVVRCQNCNEVTPIRAAPPGKKYVRCPCNCLLVCKASSNRIACPRLDCRRVITLVASAPIGTAVRAPPGTCRVQCVHCQEMFMFNTLKNNVANCPHCKKSSSVGVRYARSRAGIYFICFVIGLLMTTGIILGTHDYSPKFLVIMFWIGLILGTCFCLHRFVYFMRLKISTVLGPI